MSSRALRKAQRQREEEERQKRLAAEQEEEESDEVEEERAPAPAAKQSLFAMLGGNEDEEEGEDTDEDNGVSVKHPEQPTSDTVASAEEDDEDEPQQTTARSTGGSKKKKKKKRKGQDKAAAKTPDAANTSKLDTQLDEIELALQSLKTSTDTTTNTSAAAEGASTSQSELYQKLSVDTQSLHAANEMRRLFGRAALEAEHEQEAAAGQGRRRGRGQQQGGLAGAVAGRNAPGGRGLAALGLRRNIFIQGKEEWPRATGGGLGMEIVEKHPDGTVEYRFVHNSSYQDVQRQFQECVGSYDPQRMIQLLQFNPYHISTLLQVSEIAKQERDHATSGDLLERALFSFGRAVHSTFSNNLSQGKARLDFRRPENREFWLAAWRYIGNLGMRATWRTVYEWAKLLLSLDPEGDPYCIGLVIDQFALRARQPQHFIEMSETTLLSRDWEESPNIQISKGLAYVQNKEPTKARTQLKSAITRFPWVAARLFSELNLDPIPPAIWGQEPRTPAEKLQTELYATRAKDIWNTPEAVSILMEVASSLPPPTSIQTPPIDVTNISLNEARHAILTDTPAIISLLPRSMTSKLTSVSDPLPPPDSISSYTITHPQSQLNARQEVQNLQQAVHRLSTLQQFFHSLFPWNTAPTDAPTGEILHPPTPRDEAGNPLDPAPASAQPQSEDAHPVTEAELRAALERTGTTREMLEQRMMEIQAVTQRVRLLQRDLHERIARGDPQVGEEEQLALLRTYAEMEGEGERGNVTVQYLGGDEDGFGGGGGGGDDEEEDVEPAGTAR